MKRGRVIVYAVLLVMFLAACGKSAETLLQEQLDLGYRYLSEMNYEQAIIVFNKAIEIDEKAAEAYAGLGAVYSAQENYSAAAEAYRQALALQPENSEINQKLGEIEKKIEEAEKQAAEAELQKSLEETIGSIRAGSFDEETTLIDLDDNNSILDFLGEDRESYIVPEENYGIYRAMDHIFLYLGDYKDGERSGKGTWISIDTDYPYIAVGSWNNDKPNGFQRATHHSGKQDFTYFKEGNTVDGLWEGDVFFNEHYASNGAEHLYHADFKNGIKVIRGIHEAARNAGKPAYIYGYNAEGGTVRCEETNLSTISGIPGFAEFWF